MATRRKRPVIVSFVSGKGGVGKTMLAAAFAKELAHGCRVLLLDLDFFNRGLTALMPEGRYVGELEEPEFLRRSTGHAATWSVAEVARNVFHVTYPDLRESEMRRFATLPVDELSRTLAPAILAAASQCQCDCVVLDCHGGPDNSSFAACLLSDYTLLVSEPDRVTFYGTLNFLRQLDAARGDHEVDIRLVFNKVVAKFSGFFLRAFYRRSIRQEFAHRPLMGIFPNEIYLTKEFERTPFLTEVYPSSLLARKMRLLLRDLLLPEHKELLAPTVRRIPAVSRWYRRVALGKTLWLFRSETVMGAMVAIIFLNLVAGHLWESGQKQRVRALQSDLVRLRVLSKLAEPTPNGDAQELLEQDPGLRRFLNGGIDWPEWEASSKEAVLALRFRRLLRPDVPSLDQVLQEHGTRGERVCEWTASLEHWPVRGFEEATHRAERRVEAGLPALTLVVGRIAVLWQETLNIVLGVTLLWLLLALHVMWFRRLDLRFTYRVRARHYGHLVPCFVGALALWFVPVWLYVSLAKAAVAAAAPNPSEVMGLRELALGLLALPVLVGLALEGYRLYRLGLARQRVEVAARVVFLLSLVALGGMIAAEVLLKPIHFF